MDGDPTVEPQLDSFSLFLPLPFRVAVIIVLGISVCEYLSTYTLINTQASGLGAQTFNTSIR